MLTAASKAAKSAGMVVCASRPPTTLRARSGCTSRLREAWLSRRALLVVVAHLQAPPQVAHARTPRRATTSGVATIRTLARHLGADRGRLGDRRAEVDDGQRVAGADRVEHVARDHRVDLLGALALVGREQQPDALAVRVERLLQVADGDLVGDLDEVDDAAPVRRVHVARAGRPSGGRSRPGRPGGPGVLRAAASARCIATVVVPTPPLAPATAISGPPSAPTALSSPGHAVAQRARPLRGGADAGLELVERRAGARRRRGCRPASPCASAPARLGASSTIPTSGKLVASSRASSMHRHGAERVVQRDDVDVQPAQRAVQLLGLGDAVDDLELVALAAPARRPRDGRSRRRRSRSAAAGSLAPVRRARVTTR